MATLHWKPHASSDPNSLTSERRKALQSERPSRGRFEIRCPFLGLVSVNPYTTYETMKNSGFLRHSKPSLVNPYSVGFTQQNAQLVLLLINGLGQ